MDDGGVGAHARRGTVAYRAFVGLCAAALVLGMAGTLGGTGSPEHLAWGSASSSCGVATLDALLPDPGDGLCREDAASRCHTAFSLLRVRWTVEVRCARLVEGCAGGCGDPACREPGTEAECARSTGTARFGSSHARADLGDAVTTRCDDSSRVTFTLVAIAASLAVASVVLANAWRASPLRKLRSGLCAAALALVAAAFAAAGTASFALACMGAGEEGARGREWSSGAGVGLNTTAVVLAAAAAAALGVSLHHSVVRVGVPAGGAGPLERLYGGGGGGGGGVGAGDDPVATVSVLDGAPYSALGGSDG